MSLQKQEVPASAYIADGVKTASRNTGKKTALKIAAQLNTSSLIWLLVKRHKVGILALGNIVLVLNWAFPAWTELAKSLF